MNKSTVFSISELKKIVESSFRELFDEFLFWCEAEVGNVKKYGTRWYIDLFEYGKDGKVSAKITGIVWQDTVFQAFLKNTGNTAESIQGKKVMLQGYLSFHATYGLSISILGFSKEFEKGKQVDQRKEVIEKLKKLGLLEKNKYKSVEKRPLNFAIISSKESEGLRDFLSIIEESGCNFSHTLFESKVGGDGAIAGVVNAFQEISSVSGKYDAVFLLRGGGGQEGFVRQNNYDVCHAVATCSLPVCVAIGHTADTSLLDSLCRMPKKTPSDAAFWVIEHYSTLILQVEDAYTGCVEMSGQLFSKYKESISLLYDGIQSYSPESILKKGYALLFDNNNTLLSKNDIDLLDEGTAVSIKTGTNTLDVIIKKNHKK